MKHLLKLSSGANVMPLALQLKRNPQLWNQHTARTAGEATPHKEIPDIWVRYADDPTKEGPHDSVWYPSAELLTAVRPLAFGVMQLVEGERLGGILITKVPPGKMVKPHQDSGWHANYYSKFAVQIEGHQQQAFCYDDGHAITLPGDVYWFNNQATHWVENKSPVDRITLILCIKTAVAGLV